MICVINILIRYKKIHKSNHSNFEEVDNFQLKSDYLEVHKTTQNFIKLFWFTELIRNSVISCHIC